MSEAKSMSGRVVIITGAAKGIGRYTAHTFARAGAILVVVDIAPLERVASELEGLRAEVLAIATDVRDESQVASMVDKCITRFGQLNVLVNNAGIPTHFGVDWGGPRWPLIRDMDKAFWDRIMDTNMGGTFLCTKHVVPCMERRGGGHIINVFGGGNIKSLGSCVYVVSKDAIRTFTRYVAEEERSYGVCVVAVTPGAAIATEEMPDELRQWLPGPEFVGDRFVLAAQVGMDLSGHLLNMRDSKLVIDHDRFASSGFPFRQGVCDSALVLDAEREAKEPGNCGQAHGERHHE